MCCVAVSAAYDVHQIGAPSCMSMLRTRGNGRQWRPYPPRGPPLLQFVRDVGDGILPSWGGIVARRRGAAVSEAQRAWQLLRRGRYLEFNLLYDRGVKFGLDGGRCGGGGGWRVGGDTQSQCAANDIHGCSYCLPESSPASGLAPPTTHCPHQPCRVESIMVSAPPLIAWRYNVQPAPGSEEERLVAVLRSPQEWA